MVVGKKVIWQFWDTGLSNAPYIVKVCHGSWVSKNPSWQVIFLDRETATAILDRDAMLPDSSYPSIQEWSNHLRLLLILKFGGIWVDADVYCHQPLEDWLCKSEDGKLKSAIFESPGPDRLMANWFLSNLENDECDLMLGQLERRLRAYFAANDFPKDAWHNLATGAIDKLLRAFAGKLITPLHVARLWVSPFFLRRLRITPYFIFHYLFAVLIVEDSKYLDQIQSCAKFPASECLAIRRLFAKPSRTNFSLGSPANLPRLSKLNYKTMNQTNEMHWSPILSEIDGLLIAPERGPTT